MMTPDEERVWAYLVKNMDASTEEIAMNCDVELAFAQWCIDRIGTPREVLTAGTVAPMEGRKDDGDKAPYHLLAPEMLEATALVLGFGAKKYTIKVENEWHRLLLAPSVENVRVVTPTGSAVVVTKSTSGAPILSLQSASDKTGETGKLGTQNGFENWQNVAKTILTLVQETSRLSGTLSSLSMGSLPKDTPNSALWGAPSAEQRSTCTLIIATKQGGFEVSFAPDAITDSGFWTTTWKGLNARFGISAPVPQTGARNWEAGMHWSRPFAALMRHMWAWWKGEACDPETGYSHLWHACACLMFLVAYEARSCGTDDRPEPYKEKANELL